MCDLLNLFGSLFLLFVILGYILDLGAIFFLSLLVRVFVLIIILDFLIYFSNKNLELYFKQRKDHECFLTFSTVFSTCNLMGKPMNSECFFTKSLMRRSLEEKI